MSEKEQLYQFNNVQLTSKLYILQIDTTIAIGVLAIIIGGVVVASHMRLNCGQQGTLFFDLNSLEEQVVITEKIEKRFLPNESNRN